VETARTGGTGGHLLPTYRQSRATELLELDAEEDMIQRQLEIDLVGVQGATRVDMTAGQMIPRPFERSDECPRIFESYDPDSRGQRMEDSELYEGQQQEVDEIIADKFDGKLSMGTRILASAIQRNRTSWQGKEPRPLMRKL